VAFGVNGFAEHGGVGVKELLPGLITDDGGRLVFAGEPAAHEGPEAKDGCVVGGDGFGADEHGVAGEAEVGFLGRGERNAVERLIAVAQSAVFGIGEEGAAVPAQDGDARRVGDGERAEVNGVEEAEDGGVHANAKGEAEDGEESKGGRFAEQAEGEGEVLHERWTPLKGRMFPAQDLKPISGGLEHLAIPAASGDEAGDVIRMPPRREDSARD
jgi:hypothetical protein